MSDYGRQWERHRQRIRELQRKFANLAQGAASTAQPKPEYMRVIARSLVEVADELERAEAALAAIQAEDRSTL